MNKYKSGSFLTVGQLKEILKDMADDAFVFARDRDCISLDQVHVVNHPIKSNTDNKGSLRFVTNIEDVYGGDNKELNNNSKQAIIFCDCD